MSSRRKNPWATVFLDNPTFIQDFRAFFNKMNWKRD